MKMGIIFVPGRIQRKGSFEGFDSFVISPQSAECKPHVSPGVGVVLKCTSRLTEVFKGLFIPALIAKGESIEKEHTPDSVALAQMGRQCFTRRPKVLHPDQYTSFSDGN